MAGFFMPGQSKGVNDMKKYLSIISALLLLIAGLVWAADNTYTTGFYVEQGGNRAVVASGGSLDVESGGEIDIESGGYLKIGGTAITATAAQINDVTAGKVAVSSKAFTAGEDWELSATEAKSTILVVSSGSGTPSIVDQYVSAGTVKLFRNASNVAVTIKASGGTGVSVASGKTAVVMCVGTDYVRATADATH